jgi:hypothetical protein
MIAAGVPEAKARARRGVVTMSENAPTIPTETAKPAPTPATGAPRDHIDGFSVDVTGEEAVDKRLARIEMAGEEVASGWKPAPHEPLAPEVRYLHVSRTIHELITDRNRSVGIFLFVASLLTGASTALLNVPEDVRPIIPLAAVQYWCLPATFGTLAVIGLFVSLILIRTRIGLIYEVAKMNALLGLPTTRVERVKPFSIFYLMHALVVLLGGASAGFTVGMLAWRATHGELAAIGAGVAVGILYAVALKATYVGMILHATTEAKLDNAKP